MEVDNVKDGVGFDRIPIINLIVFMCFTIYMESLDCVHKFAFFRCVKYFHDIVDGLHGVIVI